MIERSYGIIPFNKAEELRVFLIHQYGSAGGTHWTFPKGRAEEGETEIETALRELKEETGMSLASYDASFPLSVSYAFVREGVPVEKTSTYFIGFVAQVAFTVQESEVKEAGWFSLAEARERISYEHYKVLLDRAVEHLDKS